MNILKHETELNPIESPNNPIEMTDHSDIDELYNNPALKVLE